MGKYLLGKLRKLQVPVRMLCSAFDSSASANSSAPVMVSPPHRTSMLLDSVGRTATFSGRCSSKRRSLTKLNRKLHNWGSIVIALPVVIVLGTGVLLLLKKDFDWIQPRTVKGEQKGINIGFDDILAVARTVPEAEIATWSDVDRLDVRPGKGMVKVRAENSWEIQIDANTGAVLQVAYRRTDLIESIHDGSFFGDHAKLWVFLPSALVLIGLWITGMVLFFHPYLVKTRKRRSVHPHLQKAEERA